MIRRSMAEQYAVAVEHRDVDGDAAVGNRAQGRLPRGRGPTGSV